MERIRKLSSFLLALTTGLALTACGGQNIGGEEQMSSVSTESNSSQSESVTSSDTSEQSQESPSEEPVEGSLYCQKSII